MGIIVTKKDCTLSEANAFYRVEASNLAFVVSVAGAYSSIASAKHINFTPANAGNFKGAGMGVYCSSVTSDDMQVNVYLQQATTVTMTSANPGVVTYTSHGLAVGDPVQFTTTGTLPTLVVSNTVYYARNTDCATPANEFWLYGTAAQAIAGGTTGRINTTTGTQSGVHSCWVIRSTAYRTWEEIRGGFTSSGGSTATDRQGLYLTDFHNFDVAYAVTAVANTWRLRIIQSGTTGTLNLWYGFDTTSFCHWVYCDTAVSFNNGDTPIFAHYCTIDQSASFNSVLPTGETAYGTAGVICANPDPSVDNVAFLRCLTPSASYTLDLNGVVFMSGHSGFRLGTSAVPIPIANKFILNCNTPTVGTIVSGFRSATNTSSGSYAYTSRPSMFMYGAYPTQIRTTLAQDSQTLTGNMGLTCTMTAANPCVVTRASHGYLAGGNDPITFSTTGSLPTGGTTTLTVDTTYYVKYVNTTTFRLSLTPGGADISTAGGTQSGTHYIGSRETIITTDDMSTKGWANGDTIVIGKQDIQGYSSVISNVIDTITGTSIKLQTIMPSVRRLQGGNVYNITPSKYGINLICTVANAASAFNLLATNNLNVEGCYIKGPYFIGVSIRVNDDDADANISLQTFKNSVCEANGSGGLYNLYNIRLHKLGLTVDNVWSFKSLYVFGTLPATASAAYKSGTYTNTNCGANVFPAYYAGILAKCKCYFENLYFENSGTTSVAGMNINLGARSTVNNIYFYGLNYIGAGYGALIVSAVALDSTISNVYITRCANGITFTSAAVAIGLKFDNIVMSGNTLYDLNFAAGAYAVCTFKNCNGIVTKSYTDLTDSVDGTTLSFVNNNDVTNVDFSETTYGTFTRTGDLLTDTTVHTSGTGKFALRSEPLAAGTPLEFEYSLPTGDIYNKQLVVGCRIKINSADYWSMYHQMPRITVTYDDGVSTVYGEAAQTTDRQFVFCPVTPATTFGQVSVSHSCDTLQTGSSSYVYWDDISIFYPPGVQLNLGGMDLWANALPITPPIATNINASDVRAYPSSSATTTGSIGVVVNTIKTRVGRLRSLL